MMHAVWLLCSVLPIRCCILRQAYATMRASCLKFEVMPWFASRKCGEDAAFHVDRAFGAIARLNIPNGQAG